MGRILLIIAVVIVGFMVIGSLLGLVMGLLKWALILGVIGAGIYGVSKLLPPRRSRFTRR